MKKGAEDCCPVPPQPVYSTAPSKSAGEKTPNKYGMRPYFGFCLKIALDRFGKDRYHAHMRLLFADDERNIRSVLTEELQHLGHTVVSCADGDEALQILQNEAFDALLLDLDMPGTDGLNVLEKAKTLGSNADVIILTGKGTLEAARRAIHFGVVEFLTKPYAIADLEMILNRIAKKRVERSQQASGKLTGRSEPMQRVYRLIERIAPTESTVVILGDTGTGKELVARAIHDRSRRSGKPFVAVNCGALPETLIESELFGHRKGSFTGADANRTGLFEVANGGTLFLDEIGELPKGVQAKLLRFLESGEVRKVGDNEATVCDVRVVCATLRNLETMVQAGDFREDLWFRINTFEIHIPPLKERKEDLPDLILALSKRFRSDLTETDASKLFTPEAYRILLHYEYPGNVRQLANAIEHALILSDRFPIQAEDLPDMLRHETLETNLVTHRTMEAKPSRPVIRKEASVSVAEQPTVHPTSPPTLYRNPVLELMSFDPSAEAATLRDLEMKAIEAALQRHGGSKSKAAEELGISLKTLYNKLNHSEKRTA
jgi:two-component system NtrC family response regulator